MPLTAVSASSPIRVAVVEDKLAFRRGLGAIFELTPGIQCVGMYSSGEEALREIPNSAPDVVLMDLNLPGLSGVECTRELKLARPAALVVILTIEENTERVFAALRSGASGYLLKDTAPEELLRSIHDINQGGVPMTGEVARKVIRSFSKTPPKTEGLTTREEEILNLLSQGYVSKEIASHLSISVETVKSHLKHIYDKLHVRTRTEAVIRYLK